MESTNQTAIVIQNRIEHRLFAAAASRSYSSRSAQAPTMGPWMGLAVLRTRTCSVEMQIESKMTAQDSLNRGKHGLTLLH